MITQRTIILWSTGLIFCNFFIVWKHFGCRWSTWTFLLINQETLPWQPLLFQSHIPPSFVTLVFWNGMGYHYLNVHVNSVNDASILCKNFVNFGPVIPELTAHLWTFGKTLQKLAYPVEYVRLYWTNLYNIFTVWKRFGCRLSIWTSFSDLSMDAAMATSWQRW